MAIYRDRAKEQSKDKSKTNMGFRHILLTHAISKPFYYLFVGKSVSYRRTFPHTIMSLYTQVICNHFYCLLVTELYIVVNYILFRPKWMKSLFQISVCIGRNAIFHPRYEISASMFEKLSNTYFYINIRL